MNSAPIRYEESCGRVWLTGRTQMRGSRTALSTVGIFLFGLPFVGVGVFVILIGLKIIVVDPAGVHAPYWVLTVCGVCFFAAGLLLWSMSWRQFRANRRRAAVRTGGLEGIALADYGWNRLGFRPWRWAKVLKGLAAGIALTVFLSIFNWWAFFARGPFMVKAIVSLFDLVLVYFWVRLAMDFGRALKFGVTEIEFAQFPYRAGEPVVIQWRGPAGSGEVRAGEFTLRCAEEWFETTGSGKNRGRQLVQEEVWRGTWRMEDAHGLLTGELMKFNFKLPPEAQGTALSTAHLIFWEFEVKLELPGLDFEEIYLVPIYRAT
jgi:hypothetical protein